VRTRWLPFALCLSLAPAVRGEPPGRSFTRAVQTRTAAYRLEGAPTAVVHAPPGFAPRAPLHLIVFLHGYRGCAQVLAGRGSVRCRPGDAEQPGWDLIGHHDAAGTNTLLIIPQLAFMKRSGRPGCFARPGCFRDFVQELLSDTLADELGGARDMHDVASITLVAHSAGYETVLAILEHGGVSALVKAVVLMDALYAGGDRYARWLLRDARDARLISLHIGRGTPARESKLLLRRVGRALGRGGALEVEVEEVATAIGRGRLIVARARGPHRSVPANHLAEMMRALGLPRR
jgi:pimeloyl-ACP methyl ester carboxylesterase